MLLLSNLWALNHLKKENLNFLGGGGGGGGGIMNPRIHQTPLPISIEECWRGGGGATTLGLSPKCL